MSENEKENLNECVMDKDVNNTEQNASHVQENSGQNNYTANEVIGALPNEAMQNWFMQQSRKVDGSTSAFIARAIDEGVDKQGCVNAIIDSYSNYLSHTTAEREKAEKAKAEKEERERMAKASFDYHAYTGPSSSTETKEEQLKNLDGKLKEIISKTSGDLIGLKLGEMIKNFNNKFA